MAVERLRPPDHFFKFGVCDRFVFFVAGGGRTKSTNRGVTWDKSKKMWRVRLCLPGGGREHIGCAPNAVLCYAIEFTGKEFICPMV